MRGDRMQPTVPFDPEKTETFTADKPAPCLLFSIAAAHGQPMRHLEIKSTFTSENFTHDKPVYVHHMKKFDLTYLHLYHRIRKLLFNIYGNNNSCYVNLEGLDSYLHKYNYKLSEANPFLYHKTVPVGCIVITTTVDYFHNTSPTTADIGEFKETLSLKFRITNLGVPRIFFSWTLQHIS